MGCNTKTEERKTRIEGKKKKWKQFCRTSRFCLGPAWSPPLFSKAWNSGKSYLCIMIQILPSKQFATSYTAYGKMFKYEILTSFYYKLRVYWEPCYPHKDGSPEYPFHRSNITMNWNKQKSSVCYNNPTILKCLNWLCSIVCRWFSTLVDSTFKQPVLLCINYP